MELGIRIWELPMKNSTIIKDFAVLVALVVMVGWILPALISAANTALVTLGVAIIALLVLAAAIGINQAVIHYREKRKIKRNDNTTTIEESK